MTELHRAFQRIGRLNFFMNIVCSIVNVAVAAFMFSTGGAFRIVALGFLLAATIYAFTAYVSWKMWRS